jgi:uncharacterized protein YciI
MPYAIITKDKPNSLALRERVRAEHLEYLTLHQARLLAAGAQTDDEGAGGYGAGDPPRHGGPGRGRAVHPEDPFAKAGLFDMIQVTRWRKGFFDGSG